MISLIITILVMWRLKYMADNVDTSKGFIYTFNYGANCLIGMLFSFGIGCILFALEIEVFYK